MQNNSGMKLSKHPSDIDLSVVDALIAETEGDTDKALRLLRDPEDQDSRSGLVQFVVPS